MTPEEKVRAALNNEVTITYDVFRGDPHVAYAISQTNPHGPIGWGATPADAWQRAWDRLNYIRRQDDPVPYGMTWAIARRLDLIWKEQGE